MKLPHSLQMISIGLVLVFCLLPVSSGDTIDITFQVDTQRANENNSFIIGQPLHVRCGYDSTAAQEYDIPLVRSGFTSRYQGSARIDAVIGDTLFYRYVTSFNDEEQEEYFFDYYDGSQFRSPKYKRKALLAGEEVFVEDFEPSIVTSHRMPLFPNPNTLSQDVVVVWECDMRPAYYALSAGKEFVNREIEFPIDPITDPDRIDSLGVFINGTPTGKWQFWRRIELSPFRLYDDGSHGDMISGDSIYTIRLSYPGNNTEYLISHYFKMSINGGDNEGGSGALHMVNLSDTQPEVTVRFAWGEVDPNFYSEWDYDEHQMTSVHPQPSEMMPETFQLLQNYPNPFNPATTIPFSLSEGGYMSLKIYNLLGQEIETLFEGELASGQYLFEWEAPSHLPSGVYWCQLETVNFKDLKKLVFFK
ncbi:MAG: T9SS type A sorting domain-containing protein [Gemmatimonadota bacterium]|nr:MAG: T9SS type A sorting domain-containing protein [Gemmatimonadota bacterium]